MKRLAVTAAVLVSLTGFAVADIQAPPASTYTSTRKLGRALSNILYGWAEIPEQMTRKGDDYGRKAEWSYGIADGVRRTLLRLGYGFYELITFTCPTYRGTYKQPYQRCGEDHRMEMNPHDGLSEFPPELGPASYFHYTRSQQW